MGEFPYEGFDVGTRYDVGHIERAGKIVGALLAAERAKEKGSPIDRVLSEFGLHSDVAHMVAGEYIKRLHEELEERNLPEGEWTEEHWFRQGFAQALVWLIGLEMAREEDQPFSGFTIDDN